MNDATPRKTDYDRLLEFRHRFGLTREQLADLAGVRLHEVEAIEADEAVIQPDSYRQFCETLAMTEEEVEQFVPGRRRMPYPQRKILEWRWRYGLTYETAAAKLRMSVEHYKRSEAKGTEVLFNAIRRIDPMTKAPGGRS